MKRVRKLILALAVMGPAVRLYAQPAPPTVADDLTRRLQQVQRDTRLLASPDLEAGDRALLDYGGFLTASYFTTDTSAGDNRTIRQYDLNLYARINLDGAHEFYVRNRLQYRDYNPGDETATDDDALKNYLEEAYYRFDLSRYLASTKGESIENNLTITAGRQFSQWATGLVLSQYVDGVAGQIDVGPVGVTLLAGVTIHGTADFDYSRPDFEKKTNRGYYGALVSYQVQQHRPFVYFLSTQDYNQNPPADEVSVPPTDFQYNAYYVGAGSTGNLTDKLQYTIEGVFEGGHAYSRATDQNDNPVGQETEDIKAWAGSTSLDYLFGDPHRSRVGAGFIIASGDPDRRGSSETVNGNEPGTQDRAFNGLGIVSAGYAFAPNVSNLMILRGSASTYPFGTTQGILGRAQVGLDLMAFGKTLREGPIDEGTGTDRYIGSEIDVFLNWRIVEDVTWQVRYATFFPGDSIADDSVRQFLYTSLTYSF